MKIDLEALRNFLRIPIYYFDTIDSTSLFCKRLIRDSGSFEGLVIASAQTNGQGRVGKSFFSPKDTGLYLTFSFSQKRFGNKHLTPTIALAVCRAIESVFPIVCGVKWVNDIYVSDRKIAGVLCQNVEEHLLIGIGINLEKPSIIPKDLRDRMGWIDDHVDDKKRTELIRALYQNIIDCNQLDSAAVLSEFRNRCIHIDHRIEIEQNLEKIIGVCRGIDNDFSLLVEIDGKIHAYSSGYMVLKI